LPPWKEKKSEWRFEVKKEPRRKAVLRVWNQIWFAAALQNDAATEARMPEIAGTANDRSWGNYNRRSRGNDNGRAGDNDNRTIRTASSELVAMKARPTAALSSGAIDGDE
jgi:hypothetical protein